MIGTEIKPDARVILNMPRAEYDALPGMNYSVLKHGLRSMAHLRAAVMSQMPRKDTDTLRIGQALHLLVLEPELAKTGIAVAPKINRRTNDGKAEWSAFLAASAGKIVLDPDDYATALGMAESVRADPVAGPLFRGVGNPEAVVAWTDRATGVRCKSRLDWLGESGIADLKSCQSAHPDDAARDVSKWGYDLQASFNVSGVMEARGGEWTFTWVFVENTPPFVCAAYPCSQRTLAVGKAQFTTLLHRYRACADSGVWPGYGERELEVSEWEARSWGVQE